MLLLSIFLKKTCIIFVLGYDSQGKIELLYDYITPSLSKKDRLPLLAFPGTNAKFCFMLFTSHSLSVYELFDQAKKYKKNNNIS